MSQALIHVPGGQAGFIILIIIMLIIIGMTLDAAPAILIFTPLFLPVAISLGMDPTHFLMLMVVGFAIGLTTPPYGVCLFSISAICKIPMDQLVRASWPFYVILFIALLIIAFFPSLSLFLPDLLGI